MNFGTFVIFKLNMEKKLAVVALGGNALLRGDQAGTIDEQEKNTMETLENLIFLINDGYDLVITHGNGPQVGFRRVVPSPVPVGVLNESIINDLARKGNIVIAAGGGGVPVYIDEKKDVRPAEAVVDKDLASSLLATLIGADEFYILTDVPYIYINYKKPDQEIKEFLNFTDTQKYLNEGQFTKGSMAPKIQACLNFIKQDGKKSVITEAFKLADKKYGSKITMEYEDDRR